MITSTLVYLLAMTSLFIAFLVLGIFWAIKSGQFEDLEGPAQRILMDEDDPLLPGNQTVIEVTTLDDTPVPKSH
ncbi:MAG: cbb3-type cytochrome oxidase assembly protein CcoS [Betaproteobacteria bacterium]|nr:cbb3-type cytochrome oxidase assembly protein CcoS [Betaproteobacteria bacterium]